MDERYPIIPDRPNKITVVNNDDDVGRVVEHLLRYDILGFDTETYHAFDRAIPAFDPTNGARMRLAQFATPDGDAFVFDLRKVRKEFLHYMFPNNYLCVGQNLKFEMTFLMFELGIYEFGPIWDTMIAEQILARGKVAGAERIWVGLDHIAERRLQVVLPKDQQASEWYKDELSQEQIAYAARDAQVVLPIFQAQRDAIKIQEQVRVSEIEFETIAPLAWMQNTGFTLNTDKWAKICDDTAEEIKSLEQSLWDMLGKQGTLFAGTPSINLNSHPKVQQAMLQAGIELPIDKEGNVTLSNVLFSNEMRLRPEVSTYVKWVKMDKRLKSFGPKWLDKVNPYTGRIHPSIQQIGAETGRMSCKDPNLMQIPKEEKYRNCFEAQEGWVLVDVDYSQMELRILAEYCRDKNLLHAYDTDADLHRYTAHLIYKKPMDEVNDVERGKSKNMNFLTVYGGGAKKFSTQVEIPLSEAEAILKMYLGEVYPSMGRWLNQQTRDVMHHLRTYTMSGRIRQYTGNLYDDAFKGKVQRNAKNMPIQGTSADITKTALGYTYKALVKGQYLNDIRLILPVHDELVSEAKPEYAQTALEIKEREMLRAERDFLKRVPSKVDHTITVMWAKDPAPENVQAARDLIEAAK